MKVIKIYDIYDTNFTINFVENKTFLKNRSIFVYKNYKKNKKQESKCLLQDGKIKENYHHVKLCRPSLITETSAPSSSFNPIYP